MEEVQKQKLRTRVWKGTKALGKGIAARTPYTEERKKRKAEVELRVEQHREIYAKQIKSQIPKTPGKEPGSADEHLEPFMDYMMNLPTGADIQAKEEWSELGKTLSHPEVRFAIEKGRRMIPGKRGKPVEVDLNLPLEKDSKHETQVRASREKLASGDVRDIKSREIEVIVHTLVGRAKAWEDWHQFSYLRDETGESMSPEEVTRHMLNELATTGSVELPADGRSVEMTREELAQRIRDRTVRFPSEIDPDYAEKLQIRRGLLADKILQGNVRDLETADYEIVFSTLVGEPGHFCPSPKDIFFNLLMDASDKHSSKNPGAFWGSVIHALSTRVTINKEVPTHAAESLRTDYDVAHCLMDTSLAVEFFDHGTEGEQADARRVDEFIDRFKNAANDVLTGDKNEVVEEYDVPGLGLGPADAKRKIEKSAEALTVDLCDVDDPTKIEVIADRLTVFRTDALSDEKIELLHKLKSALQQGSGDSPDLQAQDDVLALIDKILPRADVALDSTVREFEKLYDEGEKEMALDKLRAFDQEHLSTKHALPDDLHVRLLGLGQLIETRKRLLERLASDEDMPTVPSRDVASDTQALTVDELQSRIEVNTEKVERTITLIRESDLPEDTKDDLINLMEQLETLSTQVLPANQQLALELLSERQGQLGELPDVLQIRMSDLQKMLRTRQALVQRLTYPDEVLPVVQASGTEHFKQRLETNAERIQKTVQEIRETDLTDIPGAVQDDLFTLLDDLEGRTTSELPANLQLALISLGEFREKFLAGKQKLDEEKASAFRHLLSAAEELAAGERADDERTIEELVDALNLSRLYPGKNYGDALLALCEEDGRESEALDYLDKIEKTAKRRRAGQPVLDSLNEIRSRLIERALKRILVDLRLSGIELEIDRTLKQAKALADEGKKTEANERLDDLEDRMVYPVKKVTLKLIKEILKEPGVCGYAPVQFIVGKNIHQPKGKVSSSDDQFRGKIRRWARRKFDKPASHYPIEALKWLHDRGVSTKGQLANAQHVFTNWDVLADYRKKRKQLERNAERMADLLEEENAAKEDLEERKREAESARDNAALAIIRDEEEEKAAGFLEEKKQLVGFEEELDSEERVREFHEDVAALQSGEKLMELQEERKNILEGNAKKREQFFWGLLKTITIVPAIIWAAVYTYGWARDNPQWQVGFAAHSPLHPVKKEVLQWPWHKDSFINPKNWSYDFYSRMDPADAKKETVTPWDIPKLSEDRFNYEVYVMYGIGGYLQPPPLSEVKQKPGEKIEDAVERIMEAREETPEWEQTKNIMEWLKKNPAVLVYLDERLNGSQYVEVEERKEGRTFTKTVKRKTADGFTLRKSKAEEFVNMLMKHSGDLSLKSLRENSEKWYAQGYLWRDVDQRYFQVMGMEGAAHVDFLEANPGIKSLLLSYAVPAGHEYHLTGTPGSTDRLLKHMMGEIGKELGEKDVSKVSVERGENLARLLVAYDGEAQFTKEENLELLGKVNTHLAKLKEQNENKPEEEKPDFYAPVDTYLEQKRTNLDNLKSALKDAGLVDELAELFRQTNPYAYLRKLRAKPDTGSKRFNALVDAYLAQEDKNIRSLFEKKSVLQEVLEPMADKDKRRLVRAAVHEEFEARAVADKLLVLKKEDWDRAQDARKRRQIKKELRMDKVKKADAKKADDAAEFLRLNPQAKEFLQELMPPREDYVLRLETIPQFVGVLEQERKLEPKRPMKAFLDDFDPRLVDSKGNARAPGKKVAWAVKRGYIISWQTHESERFAKLTIAEKNAELKRLREKGSKTRQRIEQLNKDKERLRNEKAAREAELGELEGEIFTSEADRKRMSLLKSMIKDHEQQLKNIEKELNRLWTKRKKAEAGVKANEASTTFWSQNTVAAGVIRSMVDRFYRGNVEKEFKEAHPKITAKKDVVGYVLDELYKDIENLGPQISQREGRKVLDLSPSSDAALKRKVDVKVFKVLAPTKTLPAPPAPRVQPQTRRAQPRPRASRGRARRRPRARRPARRRRRPPRNIEDVRIE